VRHAEQLDEKSWHETEGEGGPHVEVDAAWTRALLHGVLEEMRRECAASGREDVWAVFEGRVLAEVFGAGEAVSYEELARRGKLKSPTQAANLLVTAKRMYARLLRAAVAEYELNLDDVDREIAELREMLSGSAAHEGEGAGDE
jgi:hypothetical protein